MYVGGEGWGGGVGRRLEIGGVGTVISAISRGTLAISAHTYPPTLLLNESGKYQITSYIYRHLSHTVDRLLKHYFIIVSFLFYSVLVADSSFSERRHI